MGVATHYFNCGVDKDNKDKPDQIHPGVLGCKMVIIPQMIKSLGIKEVEQR